MNRMFKAYRLIDSDTVITQKSLILDAKDRFYRGFFDSFRGRNQSMADENKLILKEGEEY